MEYTVYTLSGGTPFTIQAGANVTRFIPAFPSPDQPPKTFLGELATRPNGFIQKGDMPKLLVLADGLPHDPRLRISYVSVRNGKYLALHAATPLEARPEGVILVHEGTGVIRSCSVERGKDAPTHEPWSENALVARATTEDPSILFAQHASIVIIRYAGGLVRRCCIQADGGVNLL